MNHPGFLLKGTIPSGAAEPGRADDFIDVERLLAMVYRQVRVLALCALIGLGLGILYLATTPPTYTAVSHVLIDESLRKMVDSTTASSFTSEMETDSAMLSQIEIIRSARLAGEVVEREGLDQNESFMNPPKSLLSEMIGRARSVVHLLLGRSGAPAAATEQQDAEARRQAAILALQRQVIAQRAGRSLVIVIGFSSHDPQLAARITNTYAKAYVDDQLDAGFEATEQAAVWLEGRLAELRESSQAAALAVERYRTEYGLSAASGELMADRRLSDLNSQLAIAKADTARAYARYQQYQAIADAGPEEAVRNATISDEEQQPSELLTTLKTRYLTITRREQEIANQFGADHPQAVALRREQADVARQIHGELTQLAVNYRNQYEVALSREKALQESVSTASGESAEAKQSQVQLRELEQQANALSSLYQSFLARYEEATQQSTFPVSKVRIISAASTPESPSSPRTTLVLGLGLVLGLMMGGAFAGLNEFNERFFRTSEDVRERLGARFLGYLPLFGGEDAKGRRAGRKEPPALHPAPAADVKAQRSRRATRITIDAPGSAFAETLRNAKYAADVVLQERQSKVIGIVSALPGEGKSTVSANLAQLLAANGRKTLLIDGDLRNPGLSRALGMSSEHGLLEAVMNGHSWRAVAKIDPQTRLAVVPAMVRGQFSHTSELLSSAGMRNFLQEARNSFDYIIVDLPPLGPVIDAKAFAPLADGLIAVIEWGRTPRALVRSVLGSEPVVADRILGVVLNKVNMKTLSRYGGFGSSEKYLGEYVSYYTSAAKKAA
ncbi:polysaccharide biosynthesis tyrosine autokinase [Chelativorans sp. AA-79]|uniref:polysaccharide biosynthesis tyrosine autokinase n=1 Tax=Chelativorans sp. AA-79 TaxID=3028735 RepID=UPI0023F6A268|nr:polysaccharide biosynthesis tyrosine autokinase [Chelativorans sp. AA-79]WEX08163.1 polysaccharide biosynthesis tyrosine autokinase [Chelativorans sp. AA-79]